jgi:hypothetical protein
VSVLEKIIVHHHSTSPTRSNFNAQHKTSS